MKDEFLKAIDEHQGIILKVCRMYCSDNTEAEDLFQDILLALWKAWPCFKGNSKTSTWMYRIGLNTAITRLRKVSRTVKPDELNASHHNIASIQAVRLDIVFDKELQLAIETLGEADKALLMLYLDELSYKEIAEITGLTETNIGVKINRIKRKLKDKIRA